MPSPLITTAELAKHLADPHWIIVDSRHDLLNATYGREAYAAWHLPGAIFLSIDDDLSTAKNGRNGRHPWPSVDVFTATLARKGIGNADTVVVYDDGNAMYAGRLWWMLRWLGHDAVFVLDGGFAQWRSEGRAIDTAHHERVATTFQPRPQPERIIDAEATLAAIADPSRRILDARAPERYRGEVEPVDPVAGHIPGALNRPFALNQDGGVFKPADELRREFEVLLAGRAPSQLIHQCGSGVSACANLLAMEHAGLHGSRLYTGSWSEWCADPSRPVARG